MKINGFIYKGRQTDRRGLMGGGGRGFYRDVLSGLGILVGAGLE